LLYNADLISEYAGPPGPPNERALSTTIKVAAIATASFSSSKGKGGRQQSAASKQTHSFPSVSILSTAVIGLSLEAAGVQ